MLATLIPLFDDAMQVKAYTIFSQKVNYLLEPALAGYTRYDGSGAILGLEIVDSMGMETLAADREVFVEMNSVSVFSEIETMCDAPHNKLVLLMDHTITPEDMYVDRLKELKEMGYLLAIRKLSIEQFEPYREVLRLMDFILLDHKKINIASAKIYFGKIYPNIKLVAVNVDTQEDYDKLIAQGGYHLYEGSFFRMPVVEGAQDVAPLKLTYIELLNVVNDADFDLSDAADVIGRDTALVISLLEMVNRMAYYSGITSVRHAAAMLGQKELKKWINTAVTKELCSDKPSEIMRISLLRAKFAENLAPLFEMAGQSSELFLVGLFSVLDIILDQTMEEALDLVKVSKSIYQALVNNAGEFASVLNFIKEYESASWQEISRQLVLMEVEMDPVYDAYIDALKWYRDLIRA